MPVEGERNAPTQSTCGSSLRVSSGSRRTRSPTPFPRARSTSVSMASRLPVLGGDHQLAGTGMSDPVARAEIIERMLPARTHAPSGSLSGSTGRRERPRSCANSPPSRSRGAAPERPPRDRGARAHAQPPARRRRRRSRCIRCGPCRLTGRRPARPPLALRRPGRTRRHPGRSRIPCPRGVRAWMRPPSTARVCPLIAVCAARKSIAPAMSSGFTIRFSIAEQPPPPRARCPTTLPVTSTALPFRSTVTISCPRSTFRWIPGIRPVRSGRIPNPPLARNPG